MSFSAAILSVELYLVSTLRLYNRARRLAFSMGLAFCVSAFTAWLASQIAGFPTPSVQDEFGYLLSGEIFASGHLAMPSHPMGYFFETLHQLQWPSYVPKYPPGQGLILALGFILGEPIYGVWISVGAMAAATVWMLAGFGRVRWALIGGLTTGLWLGGFSYWAQSFWGGALVATGAALVWGGIRRIWTEPRSWAFLVMGTGAALLLLTRPFEGFLACLAPGLLLIKACLIHQKRGSRFSTAIKATWILPPILLAVAFQLACNQASTGSPWRMAYSEYRHQYDRNPIFIWEKPQMPPDYDHPRMEAFDILVQETAARHVFPVGKDLWTRIISLDNFYLAGAGIMLVMFLCFAPTKWSIWASVGVMASLSSILWVYAFNYHYFAAAVAPLVILITCAIRYTYVLYNNRLNLLAPIGITIFALSTLGRGESADFRKSVLDLKAHRSALIEKLQKESGEHLILVRYERGVDPHIEYVFNGAHIDKQKIVWARWTEDAGTRGLFKYFAGRRLWMLTVRKQGTPLLREFNWVAEQTEGSSASSQPVISQTKPSFS